MEIRSLYDCFHARYPTPPNEYVVCDKGHKLGYIHKRRVDRQDRLILKICRLCPDFEDMNDNHKGSWCIYNEEIFCQEGYCGGCNLNPHWSLVSSIPFDSLATQEIIMEVNDDTRRSN